MKVRFCPGCGAATQGGAAPDFCGSCGADLSGFEVVDSTEVFGQKAFAMSLSDSVVNRSNIQAGGPGPEGDGEAGISDTIINRSVVTSIGSVTVHRDASCPLCDNRVDGKNTLSSCPVCSVKLCGMCRDRVEKNRQARYRGYKLDYTPGTCLQCYRTELARQKDAVDRRLGAAVEATEAAALLRSYTEEERSLLTQAAELLDAGAFAKALEAFDKVLDLNAENLLAQEGRLNALMALEYFQEAADFARSVVERNPALGWTHLVLAEALYNSGHADDGKAVLIKRTKAQPDDPMPWLRLGQLYIGEGQSGKAAALFRHAMDADSEQRLVEPYVFLAHLALENGEYKRAADLISRGALVDGGNAGLNGLRRELARMRRMCQSGLAEDLEALEGLGKDEGEKKLRLLKRIGDAHASLGDEAAARKHYKMYLKQRPGDEAVEERLKRLGGQ